MISLIKESDENRYRVWYEPYGLTGEDDYMDVTANNEEEARRRVSSSGYVTSVEPIFSTSYVESKCVKEDYEVISTKSVPDYDGFLTDYTLYKVVDDMYYPDGMYVCILGDNEVYNPNNTEADYEDEDYNSAYDWFVNYEGYVDDEDNEYESYRPGTSKQGLSESIDIMTLSTSERAQLILQSWDNLDGGLNTFKVKQYLETQGWDTSNWDMDTFNSDWDVAVDLSGEVEEDEDEGMTQEEASQWLRDKIAEYGNTYHFPAEDKATLNTLIQKFGNTYFWH